MEAPDDGIGLLLQNVVAFRPAELALQCVAAQPRGGLKRGNRPGGGTFGQRLQETLLGRVVGLRPHAVKIYHPPMEEVRVEDGFHVGEGEARLAFYALVEDLVVEVVERVPADLLHEVGLAAGLGDDALDGGGVVVEGEVFGGVGDELPGRGVGEV